MDANDFLTIYIIVTCLLAIVCLALTAQDYNLGDKEETKTGLLVTALTPTWPIAIPVFLVYGLYRMISFAYSKEDK